MKKNKIKLGVISYNTKEIPKSLHINQIHLANEIANAVIKLGLDAKIEYDSGTIDVVIAVVPEVIKQLNIARFRVFWSSVGDFKVQYLCAGYGYCDGYEIKRGWTKDLELKDIADVLIQDIARIDNLGQIRKKLY